ncbi:MAG: DUF2339 domain-containing protein [Bacteroidota bacterium]
MISFRKEIDDIRSKQAEIRAKFESDFASLENRITSLEQHFSVPPPSESRIPATSEAVVKNYRVSDLINRPESTVEPPPPVDREIVDMFEDKVNEEQQPIAHIPQPIEHHYPPYDETKPRNPLLAALFHHLEFPIRLYRHYKAEQKLPIFFMTLSGILALLFGFGYLMQYSINHYFGDYSEYIKTGFGFVFSSGVLVWAIKLTRKDKEKYGEFGSALMGMVVALNYLFIYFLSDIAIPFRLPAYAGFLMILMNSALGAFLALRHHTKVVAILFLIGGSFSPIYLDSSEPSILFYLYVGMISITSLFIARRIKWVTLGYIAFLVAMLILEASLLRGTFEAWPALKVIGLVYGFGYLFVHYGLFDGVKIKRELKPMNLIIITASVSLILVNLYYSIENSYLLGALYLQNAVLALMPLIKRGNRSNKMLLWLLITIAATFTFLAIPALVDAQVTMLLWSAKGLLLIYLGFLFKQVEIRIAGYIVLLIPIVKTFMGINDLVISWHETIWIPAFYNFIVLGIVMTGVIYLIKRFQANSGQSETRLHLFLSQIVPVWIAGMLLIISAFHFRLFTFNLVIVPAFALIFWGAKKGFKSLETIGMISLVGIVLGYYESQIEVGTFHFIDQTLTGKIALIEIALCSWSLLWVYQKLNIKGDALLLARFLRKAFYVAIPICIISSTWRSFPEYIGYGIAVASFTSYLLYKFLRETTLKIEYYILVSISIAISILHEAWLLNLINFAMLLAVFIVEKGHLKKTISKSAFRYAFSLLLYYALYTIFYLCHDVLSIRVSTSIMIISMLFFLLVYLKKHLYLVRRRFKMLFFFGVLALFISILFQRIFNPGFSTLESFILIINFGVYTHLSLTSERFHAYLKSGTRRLNFLAVNFLGTVTYVHLLITHFESFPFLVTIAIVLHGIALIFLYLSLQERLISQFAVAIILMAAVKLVFIDLAHFEVFDKVVVLIVIGILFLGASYAFVRIKNRMKHMQQPHNSRYLL